MARAAALRRVTSDIEKLTFFFTCRTFLWQQSPSEDKSTLPTFPICFIALWTNISGEPSICRESAVGAFIFFLFILHVLHLQFYIRYSKILTIKMSR